MYDRIKQTIIVPRDSGSLQDASYSMLLYGPQGTGKTTLAEDLANVLGCPLVIITPSDFIVGGEASVEARTKAIFDVLGAQSETVVLFDEIDRLILDRDSKMYQAQSDIFQFMTPGMLTKFRDLRRFQRVVFVISTNYAERIDPAIKRAGRIDDQFILLPPDSTQRKRIILSELTKRTKLSSSDFDVSELADVVSATVLMIPGELQNLVRRGTRASGTTTIPTTILNHIKAEAKHAEPSIRLETYRGRFRWTLARNETLETNQEPFTEFFLLLYLLLDAGRDLADYDIVGSYVEHLRKSRLKAVNVVASHVHDPSIAKRISDALGHPIK